MKHALRCQFRGSVCVGVNSSAFVTPKISDGSRTFLRIRGSQNLHFRRSNQMVWIDLYPISCMISVAGFTRLLEDLRFYSRTKSWWQFCGLLFQNRQSCVTKMTRRSKCHLQRFNLARFELFKVGVINEPIRRELTFLKVLFHKWTNHFHVLINRAMLTFSLRMFSNWFQYCFIVPFSLLLLPLSHKELLSYFVATEKVLKYLSHSRL